jgi:hypothetical protein
MNMLITEWNWDDALAVRYEEGFEDGLKMAMEKRLTDVRVDIAKKALKNGLTIDAAVRITGLDLETINSFGVRQN